MVWEELDGLERADCWGVGRFVCWNEKFEKEASGLKPALASEKGTVGRVSVLEWVEEWVL